MYSLIWNSKYLLKETTEHVKWRDSLQSHWFRLNKNVLEGKETVSNLSKLKETKETLQLKPVCDPG